MAPTTGVKIEGFDPVTVIARNAVTHDERRRVAHTGREFDAIVKTFTRTPVNAVRMERNGVVVGIIRSWEEAQASTGPNTECAEPSWFSTDGTPGTVAEITTGACPWCGEPCDGDPRVIIVHARAMHGQPATWEAMISSR